MKLLYEIQSGTVLCRLSESTIPSVQSTEPQDGQALIEVPESVIIPEAVIRVVSAENNHEFITDPALIERQWTMIKSHRSQLLKESDWTCSVTDYTPPNKEQWVAYRQALRDITAQPNPFRLVWPSAPSAPSVATSATNAISEPVSEPIVTASATASVTEPVSEPIVTASATEPVSEPIATASATEPTTAPESASSA